MTNINTFRHILPLLLLGMAACQGQTAAPTSTVTAPAATRPAASPTSRPTAVRPTATSTLAPAPESFTEEFDAGAPYWIYLQSPGGGAALEAGTMNGALRLTLGAGNLWGYALYEPHVYSDVRIDAVVELGAGGDGSGGVICRHSAAAGWYEFNIHADGTYALLFGQWLAEGIARYTPLLIDVSETIAEDANEIGLACIGDVLTGYINGKQIRSRQEKQHVLTEGTVGLSATSFETAPVVISFDQVSVGNP